jgi:hypothetical protein
MLPYQEWGQLLVTVPVLAEIPGAAILGNIFGIAFLKIFPDAPL